MRLTNLKPLTKRQAELAAYIRQRIYSKGFPPTVREIGKRFGIQNPNGVRCHLLALEKKGVIRRVEKKSRAIELVAPLPAGPSLPYGGEVS